MKQERLARVIVMTIIFLTGCKSGPATLMPTLAKPYTQIPQPTQTPVPTASLIPTETGIPTETPIPTARVRRQATLRSGPGVSYPVAGHAQFNESIIIYAQCEGWYQVSADGSKWIIDGKVILDVDPVIIPDVCAP